LSVWSTHDSRNLVCKINWDVFSGFRNIHRQDVSTVSKEKLDPDDNHTTPGRLNASQILGREAVPTRGYRLEWDRFIHPPGLTNA
jgi:hypothetical protein